MDEARRQVLRLFCQHCQALRKTFGWETKEVCWYERWFDEDSAICASAQDAAKAILSIPAIAQGIEVVKKGGQFQGMAEWLMGQYLIKTGDHYKIERKHTERMRNGLPPWQDEESPADEAMAGEEG